jgi:hypothetical protein
MTQIPVPVVAALWPRAGDKNSRQMTPSQALRIATDPEHYVLIQTYDLLRVSGFLATLQLQITEYLKDRADGNMGMRK